MNRKHRARQHTELGPAVGAAESMGDPACGTLATDSSSLGVIEGGASDTGLFGQADRFATGQVSDDFTEATHTSKGKTIFDQVNSKQEAVSQGTFYASRMTPPTEKPKAWPQHIIFASHLERWITKYGESHPGASVMDAKNAFCGATDVSNTNTLKQYISGLAKPGGGRATRFAEVLGCTTDELLGGPSGPGGLDAETLSAQADEDKPLLSAIAADMAMLSSAQKVAAFRAWKAMMKLAEG